MWAEPEVVRYITGKPSTRAETWARMARYRGFWSLLGYGYWALQEKSSARFIGEVGFFDVLREIEPSIAGTPEVGWILTPAFHAKGFAREALGAVLAWADATLPAERTADRHVRERADAVMLSRSATASLSARASRRLSERVPAGSSNKTAGYVSSRHATMLPPARPTSRSPARARLRDRARTRCGIAVMPSRSGSRRVRRSSPAVHSSSWAGRSLPSGKRDEPLSRRRRLWHPP